MPPFCFYVLSSLRAGAYTLCRDWAYIEVHIFIGSCKSSLLPGRGRPCPRSGQTLPLTCPHLGQSLDLFQTCPASVSDSCPHPACTCPGRVSTPCLRPIPHLQTLLGQEPASRVCFNRGRVWSRPATLHIRAFFPHKQGLLQYQQDLDQTCATPR